MGVIRKVGKSWWIDYRFEGKRFRKRIGRSKEIAELALKDIEVRLARGETGFLIKNYSIRTLIKEFLEYSSVNHSSSTYNRYRAVIDHLLAFLQIRNLDNLSQFNPRFFEEYKIFRKSEPTMPNGGKINPIIVRKGASSKTINFELDTFRTMFNLAIKWGYIQKNPAREVQRFKIINPKTPRFLTQEECQKLLSNCGPELYPVFYTFLHTGMRLSELLNLTWEDVDFQRHKIKIQKKSFWHPKTGEREIPINQKTETVLKNLPRMSEFVFTLKGKKIAQNRLRPELMKITKTCGFPDVTKIHSLRHTFASHLVMSGVDLPTVQKLLGHSEIETTMIYSHLSPDHLVEVVSKLNFEN